MKYFIVACILFSIGDANNYEIKLTSISSEYKMDFCPRKFQSGIIFTSNGENNNSSTSAPSFDRLYYSEIIENELLSSPVEVKVDFNTPYPYHIGIADFCEISGEIYLNATNPSKNRDKFNLAIFKGYFEDGIVTRLEKMPFCQPEYSYFHPTISESGKLLIFASNMDGSMKLYQLKRNSFQSKWTEPELIEELDSDSNNMFPNLINDSLLLFSSNSEEGLGGYDIYRSQKISDTWDIPENWKALNSERDENGVEMMDSLSGYLTSTREFKADKIYFFRKEN